MLQVRIKIIAIQTKKSLYLMKKNHCYSNRCSETEQIKGTEVKNRWFNLNHSDSLQPNLSIPFRTTGFEHGTHIHRLFHNLH